MADISTLLEIIKNTVQGKEMRKALHDSIKKVNDDCVDKNTIASPTQLGMIKLLASNSGVNRSGLIVDPNTGVAYVAARSDRGLYRDGAGQLYINPATDEEVTSGTEPYKPITPKTLKTVTDGKADTKHRHTPDEVDGLNKAMSDLESSIGELETDLGINYYDKTETDTKLSVKADTSALSIYATKTSPTFTGIPKAPTASVDTNNTQIATTQFVANAIKKDNTYYNTITQIGTWINGIPIWRIAFKTIISAQSTIWTEKYIHLDELTGIELKNDLEFLLFLNSIVHQSIDIPNVIDNQICKFDNNDTWIVSYDRTKNIFHGFIEFITPASNIIVGKFIKDYYTMTSEQGEDEIVDWVFENPSGDAGTKILEFVEGEGIGYSHATRNASSYAKTHVNNIYDEIFVSGTWNTGNSKSATGNSTYISFDDGSGNIVFAIYSSFNDRKVYLEFGQNKIEIWNNVRDTVCSSADVDFGFTYNTKTGQINNITISSSDLQYELSSGYSGGSTISEIRIGADMTGSDPKTRVTMDCVLKNINIVATKI